MTDRFDAVVIGAGIAGLTAAAYLSVAGRRTLLLEQYDVAGGCTHVFRRSGEWEFEVGIHYLGDCGPGGVIPTMLRGVGLEGRIDFLPLDRDGFDVLAYPGLGVQVPVGWDRYEANLLAALDPADGPPIRRWIAVLRQLGERLDRVEGVASIPAMIRGALRTGTAGRWALRPMTDLMDHCGLRGRARNLASTQFCAYACPPSRAPVVLHAGFLQNYVGRGAYFPAGGGQMIPAHLVEAIKAHGGTVRTQAHVERIAVTGGRVTGVQLASGELVRADAVVAAGDVKQALLGMVGPAHLRRGTTGRLERARMTAPWVNVYLGIRGEPQDMPTANVFSFPTWDEPDTVHADLVDNGPRRPRAEWVADAERRLPAFVHCGSAKDPDNPRLAPPGHVVLEAMTPIPGDPAFWGATAPARPGAHHYRDSDAYQELKEQVTEILIDRAAVVVPNLRDRIVWRETGTPLTQQRYTLATSGSAYGLEYSGWRLGALRPGPATEIRGLFLAGASGPWGPGVEGSMLSGLHAAAAILDRPLAREIRAGAVLGDPTAIATSADWDPLLASKRMAVKARAVA